MPYLLELIGLVEDDKQLVIHTSKRVEEDVESFPSSTRLVGIKKEQHNIGSFGKPPDDTLKVVSTVHGVATLVPSIVRTINHSGRVDQHEIGIPNVLADLELGVMDQCRAKLTEILKAHVGIANQGWTILVLVVRSW